MLVRTTSSNYDALIFYVNLPTQHRATYITGRNPGSYTKLGPVKKAHKHDPKLKPNAKLRVSTILSSYIFSLV